MPRVASRMRELRAQLRYQFGKEYTVRACAERAGVSQSAWWSYERGIAMPPADAAVAIARVLGVTVEQLDFRRADMTPDDGHLIIPLGGHETPG